MTKLLDFKIIVLLQLALSPIIINSLGYPLSAINILETWILATLLLYFFPRWWKIYMVITSVTILIYYPTATCLGAFSLATAAALLSTDQAESVEYLGSITWSTYLASIILASLPLILIKLTRHTALPKSDSRTRVVILLIFSGIIIFAGYQQHKARTLQSNFAINAQPLKFIADAVILTYAYHAEFEKIKTGLNKPVNITVDKANQKYKFYVLVIGESARADYLHLYGFKISNTPFMDKKANYIMENMYSTGPYTQIALPFGLTLNNGQDIQIRDNILTLAKKANMDTIWISNQGAINQFDSKISTLAYQANKVVFLKNSSNKSEKNTFDDQLIQPLTQILDNQSDQRNKLIVLHLMGSHWDFCARLRKPATKYVSNSNYNCYIDSIKATDSLLQQIYTTLEKTKQPFSILYFADHGLSHDQQEKDKFNHQYSLRHTDRYYQNYHIPLVIINSDQTSQIRNPAQRSGFELLGGLANWLGIFSQQLPNSDQFFTTKDSKEIKILDKYQQLKPLNSLQQDTIPVEIQQLK